MKVFNNVIGGFDSNVIDVSNLNEITVKNDIKLNCISLNKGTVSSIDQSFVVNLNVTADTILVFSRSGVSLNLTININDGDATLTVAAKATEVFEIVNYGSWAINRYEQMH